MSNNTVSTTCPYCGVGCGLVVTKKAASKNQQQSFSVQADANHPANLGRFCSKGAALAETLEAKHEPPRLDSPMINGKVSSWQHATHEIASRINSLSENYGADSIAFYLSGQLLTEDYYVANKFMKGFIGSANVDTNSRLCMSSAVAAYKRAFGSDTVPCDYQDIDACDLIVLIGSNAAWTHPVLYQRIMAAKQRRPDLKIVVIDPRETPTAQSADLHLKITPSSDAFIFQGLLRFLIEKDAIDQNYIDASTEHFESAKAACYELSQDQVVKASGVSAESLSTFYRWFATTKKTISFYSQGINQSASGTDKANAIINCHLATAKLGFAGAGPFSITGQPNAMGGREVGGLANMLAAHMDFNEQDCDRVQRFWRSPVIARQPGLKAVDLFQAMHRGEIKFVWIMATNPAVSLPDSNFVREALAKCETVVVSDVTHTDTTAFADIVLPALAWGEKDGTVTNSERCISRQRAFKSGPELARADWQAIAEVACQLGFKESFDYKNSREVFIEHAALSDFENEGQRDFDIGVLAQLSLGDYEALKPSQWPLPKTPSSDRLFSDGRFYTTSKKAQFVPIKAELAIALNEIKSAQQKSKCEYILNSGRVRDQWHTMSRTGFAPALTLHAAMPEVTIHPSDAKAEGLRDRQIICVSNEFGSVMAQVKQSAEVSVGELFLPMHWSNQFSKQGLVNALTPQRVDPISGQPELKASKVTLRPLKKLTWLRLISNAKLESKPSFMVWNTHYVGQAWVTTIGIEKRTPPHTVNHSYIDALFADELDLKPGQSFYNPLKSVGIEILVTDEGLFGILAKSDESDALPSELWLKSSFESTDWSRAIRGEQEEYDELVCACFSTTKNQLRQLVSNGMNTLEALSANAGCGSKCGSCRPELTQLINAHTQ